MKLIEVKDKKTANEFIRLPLSIYKNEKNWIRPLDKDIEGIFDPKTNKTHRHGEIIRWILQDEEGKTVGRVAAFVNEKTAKKDNDQPTGGIGFFECINDQGAADLLFDKCKEWLKEKGMEAMDGPINFGDRNSWWGLLVEGFNKEPNYTCNYNLPYYRSLFENYGFQMYFKQYTYHRDNFEQELVPRAMEKAERVFKNPDYSFKHIRLNELDKFTEYFRTIYNKAWGGHKGVPTLTSQGARHLMKQMKPIIDERIMWFGFHKEEPIAFFIMLPEVNQIFKHLNGSFNWLAKLKFLYHKWRGKNKKMLAVVFGVAPEFQSRGIDSAIAEYVRIYLLNDLKHYNELELNWIGDFNPKMMRVAVQIGGTESKTHITYRKLFDESKPFKRHPILP